MIDTKNLNLPEAVSAGFLIHVNPVIRDAIIADPIGMITRGPWIAEIMTRMVNANLYLDPALVQEFRGLIKVEGEVAGRHDDLQPDKLDLAAILAVCRTLDNGIDAFCANRVRPFPVESGLYDARGFNNTVVFMRKGKEPVNIDVKVLMMSEPNVKLDDSDTINLVSMLSTGA